MGSVIVGRRREGLGRLWVGFDVYPFLDGYAHLRTPRLSTPFADWPCCDLAD